MLKNVSRFVITLKSDGQAVQLAPGQQIDVGTAFDMPPSSASAQEARFLAKYPGSIVLLGSIYAEAVPTHAMAEIIEKEVVESEETEEVEKPISHVESLSRQSKKELVEMAKTLGLEDASAKRSKEALIEMIDEAMKKAGV